MTTNTRGYRHHPPFVQILAAPDGDGHRLYGLAADGHVWQWSFDYGAWLPMRTDAGQVVTGQKALQPFSHETLAPLGPGDSWETLLPRVYDR